jgi:hypothetical protein
MTEKNKTPEEGKRVIITMAAKMWRESKIAAMDSKISHAEISAVSPPPMTTHSPHKQLSVIRPDGREEAVLRTALSSDLRALGLPRSLQEEILKSRKIRSLVLAELRQAHLTSL